MRTNLTKRSLAEGKSVIGAAVSLGSPLSGEILSRAGFDFVMVDNQHGAWDDNGSMLAFRCISLFSATPFIRVQQNDYYTIGRALDRGALGIIVPMVNSAKEAREAARATRYPPRGGRSIGPFGTGFLGDDYVQEINDEVYLAVQIESKQAAERAGEIMNVDGVDGCWLGPGDLGLSMGVDLSTAQGRDQHETVIAGVLKACQDAGKVPGIAGTLVNAGERLQQGFRFVTVGAESSLLSKGADDILHLLRG